MIQNNMVRNWKFDYLKGISCIIVVFLHCPIYGIIGDAFIYAIRFSVPLFFMITGYYVQSKDDLWISKKAFSLLRLLLITEFLYFVYFVVDCCFIRRGKLIAELSALPALKHPVRTILCGYFFNETLWYLYAAFWTYIILLFFRKIKLTPKSWVYYLLPFALICLQVFGRYYVQNSAEFNIDTYIYVFRSAILFGLPLTMTGSLLAQQEEAVRKRLSFAANILIIAAGHLMIFAEYFLGGQYMDFHFSTLVISIGLFLLAFTYEGNLPLKRPLTYIGRELSVWIYLDQFFVIQIFNTIGLVCYSERNTVYLIAKPFLACMFSVLLAVLISILRRRKLHFFSEYGDADKGA